MTRNAATTVARTVKTGQRWGWRVATDADMAAVAAAGCDSVIVGGDVCAIYTVDGDQLDRSPAYNACCLARLGYGQCVWESPRWERVQAVAAARR